MSYLLLRQLSYLMEIAMGTLIAMKPIAIVAIAMVSIEICCDEWWQIDHAS